MRFAAQGCDPSSGWSARNLLGHWASPKQQLGTVVTQTLSPVAPHHNSCHEKSLRSSLPHPAAAAAEVIGLVAHYRQLAMGG